MQSCLTFIVSPHLAGHAHRYDFYQTETAVNLSVFVKGLTESDVDVVFGQHSVRPTATSLRAPPVCL